MPLEDAQLSSNQSTPTNLDRPEAQASTPPSPRPRRSAPAKLVRAAGPVFAAALSVYLAQALVARAERSASLSDPQATPADVKVLDEPTDLFNDGGATTRPATQPEAQTQGQPISPNAMQVNPDGTFTLNITRDADLVETLRLIGFQVQKSIIPSKEVHGVLPALDLYNVTAHEALDAILRVNGYAFKEQGNFIYVYSQKELDALNKANRVSETRVFRLHYTPAENAMVMIKPALSENGEVAISAPPETGGVGSGGASGSGAGGSSASTGGDSHAAEDMLVIRDYPDNLDAVARILKEIDVRPQQILVEATILQATLQENNQFGVNLTAFDGVDFSTLNSTGSSGGSSGSSGTGSGVQDALNGNIINDSASGAITQKGYIGGAISGQNGLQFGMVYNNLALFINALESVTDTTILANPKILALNKQQGEVVVGREDGYLTTTVTQTTSTQTVEFLQTGTTLSFRPFIGDDGYIRMEIHPEDSSGGINTLGGQNLPYKSTTEVTSNIMVKDGHTIVIGGLFRESNSTTRSQVPFMGNLPLVGSLFGQTQDATTRQEIIILLTPHIIKDEAGYAAASAEEMKVAERIRVGSRKEMMPSGRERLSECAYEQAVAEMRKANPDRQKAIWYLDSAINLNPRFVEAIQMKEDLTGQVVTDVDNSTIRSFVAKQILAEQNIPEYNPPEIVPIVPAPAPPSPANAPATQSALQALPVAKPAPIALAAAIAAPAPQPATAPAATAAAPEPPSIAGASFDDDQPTTQPVASTVDNFDSDEPAASPAANVVPPPEIYSEGISAAFTAPPPPAASTAVPTVQTSAIIPPTAISAAAPVPPPTPAQPGQARSIFKLIDVAAERCQDTCASIARTTSQIVAIAYAKSISPTQTTVTQLPSDDKE
jgi:type IV pilus assembly protein PilQ